VKHVVGTSFTSWRKEPEWNGVKISGANGISEGQESYGPFVESPSNSNYYVKLSNGTARISKEGFYEEAEKLFLEEIRMLREADLEIEEAFA
jgi:hypothetical protein